MTDYFSFSEVLSELLSECPLIDLTDVDDRKRGFRSPDYVDALLPDALLGKVQPVEAAPYVSSAFVPIDVHPLSLLRTHSSKKNPPCQSVRHPLAGLSRILVR